MGRTSGPQEKAMCSIRLFRGRTHQGRLLDELLVDLRDGAVEAAELGVELHVSHHDIGRVRCVEEGWSSSVHWCKKAREWLPLPSDRCSRGLVAWPGWLATPTRTSRKTGGR